MFLCDDEAIIIILISNAFRNMLSLDESFFYIFFKILLYPP